MKESMKMIIAVLVTAVVCIAGTYVIAHNDSGNNSPGSITLTGSTTVQPLMDQFGEEFNKYSNIGLNISGGGSGVGISDSINGKNDIGMSSRSLKPSEMGQGLVVTEIAGDAVAIIINSGLAPYLTNLTKAQVQEIFTSTDSNLTWSSYVDGSAPDNIKNMKIAQVIRDASSGTRTSFEELTGAVAPAGASYVSHNSTGAVITAVNGTPGAIGYVSLGSLTSDCHAVSYNGQAASVANIANYELKRTLILVTKGEPTGKVAFFIGWILSSQGQKIVENGGYIPIQTYNAPAVA